MNDNIDLRTCPLPQLCEWVATNIYGYTKPSVDWVLTVCGLRDLSLDAVAAVEAKAREGRLCGWFQHIARSTSAAVAVDWAREFGPVAQYRVSAPTEPEARLRAVALAWHAAGKDGAR